MNSTLEEFIKYIDQLESEARAFKKEALRIAWYMRGGLTYDDVMALSAAEREDVVKIIEDNLETTKKSGLPFF